MKPRDMCLTPHMATMAKTIWKDVQSHADTGIECPCCGQLVQRYRRRLHTEMARFLYRLYQADRNDFGGSFHVRQLNPATAKASTDAAYLVHWDLLDKDGCGHYTITDKGRAFVEGKLFVPEYIHMLCGKFECFSDNLISIHDVLGPSVKEWGII